VTTPRLAQAIAAVVETKLAAGTAFLRVPEIVSPFPLAGLLDALHEVQDTRYAVFLEHVDVRPGPKLTLQVHEAILWRNDQRMTDNLVVIGDLERDRTAGLSSLPTVTAREVRQRLIRTLTYLARRTAANAKTLKIIDALKNERLNLDLQSLADYCDHLEPHLGTNDLQEACAGFWYLKLLPDRVSADVDIKRLRDNQARVTELRQADATSVQRLIGALSATGSGNYESLRMFASTGRREHLRNLELDAVREAVKATTGPEVDEDDNAGGDTPGQAERTDFLGAVRKDAIPEDDFLDQIRADREDVGAGGRINAGGAKIDWDSVPDGQLGPLMEQDGDVLPYAVAAGSLEHMPADEADPLPGRGKVEWGDLRDVVKELKVLEEVADVVPHPRPSSILETILARRLELADWVTDIPREGLRLFLGAPTVADTARDLVNMWVSLWRSLDDLRGTLDDEVGELIALGNRLAVTDTRIVEQGTAITAYLLQLHPMVLEPRVRAASMFREHPELDQDFFQIIQSALDPAVPSIKLPVGDTSFDLAYSGQFRGLPQYVRRSTQFHSADVVRAIQDSIDRFVNVHPYSKLSLRVALVDPTAETAKQMLKWLANVDPSRRERVALDVYAINESPGEIQSKLAEGREDLVSAEISSTRFDYTLKPLNKLEELPAALRQSDRSPHVLCLFDPAVVRNTPVPVASLTPVLGALVNEWEFGARAKKEATPYIRPKTGSTALNDFLTAQSRLLGNDTHSATERNPLLQDDVLAVLDKVSAETSWVVVAQGASALVAPPNIGEAELLGRTSSGSHTAYVYSRTPALVLEPVLTYLQQYQYIQSDPRLIMRFVLQTIRLALPEGLLGFYKRLGTLSKESVLGRLGLAAVVAYLQQDDEHDADLIVSLDTEGARRWLGLRDGVNKRADLVRLAFGPEGCAVEAIEIKARTGSLVWGASTPDVVVEATEQVEAMYALVQAIFSDERDLLVASRDPQTPGLPRGAPSVGAHARARPRHIPPSDCRPQPAIRRARTGPRARPHDLQTRLRRHSRRRQPGRRRSDDPPRRRRRRHPARPPVVQDAPVRSARNGHRDRRGPARPARPRRRPRSRADHDRSRQPGRARPAGRPVSAGGDPADGSPRDGGRRRGRRRSAPEAPAVLQGPRCPVPFHRRRVRGGRAVRRPRSRAARARRPGRPVGVPVRRHRPRPRRPVLPYQQPQRPARLRRRGGAPNHPGHS